VREDAAVARRPRPSTPGGARAAAHKQAGRTNSVRDIELDGRGTQFDTEIVDALLACLDDGLQRAGGPAFSGARLSLPRLG